MTGLPNESSLIHRAARLCWPREHGSWSLALEPVALGLLTAPSTAGAALGAAVFAAFFLRRPWRLLLAGGDDPRRRLALGCVAVVGAAAAAGLTAAAVLAGPDRLWPLLLAAPPGALYVWLDSRGEARAAGAELAGVGAFAAVPAAIGATGGWPAGPALALGAVMLCRSVPAVMTIRAWLRSNKGEIVPVIPAAVAAVAAPGAAALLAAAGLAPWTGPWIMAVFLARTAILLGPWHLRWSASRLGLAESVLGGLAMVVLAASWPAFQGVSV